MPVHLLIATDDHGSEFPSVPAQDRKPGAIMKGGNGTLWIVQLGPGQNITRGHTEEPAGTGYDQRWVLYCAAGEREVLYFAHDNGGRPFMVRVSPRIFAVYKMPATEQETQHEFETRKDEHFAHEGYVGLPENPPPHYFSWLVVGPAPYSRIFAAEDADYPDFGLGHAVLIQTVEPSCEGTSAHYIFVGWQVQHFFPNEDIVSFESYLAGSDVAYPSAVGAENTYLMVERRRIVNSERVEGQTPYEQYFSKVTGPMRIVNGMITTRLADVDLDALFAGFEMPMIHARV